MHGANMKIVWMHNWSVN